MHVRHRPLVAVFLLTAVGFGAAAGPVGADGLSGLTPAEEYRGSFGRYSGISRVLAPYRTQRDMVEFVGALPRGCQAVPRGAKICVWRLSNQEKGWRPLAEALDTGDRLNLVCEFPARDAPRAEESCSVHSQRSNRRYYRNQLNAGSVGVRIPKSVEIKKRATFRTRAKQLLAERQTAFELSTLVGDAPVECRSGEGRVFCTWKTTADTYGHGTLAMSIGAHFNKKVRMHCVLPADGSPRAPDSCRAQIGD